MKNLILILGDQLSHDLSSLKTADKTVDTVLMAELRSETGYVKHHKKKIALLFSAMRHFAEELRADGWQVDYRQFSDPNTQHDFTATVQQAILSHQPDQLIVTKPGEHRVLQEMMNWENILSCAVHFLEDDRFFASTDEFESWQRGENNYAWNISTVKCGEKQVCLWRANNQSAGNGITILITANRQNKA